MSLPGNCANADLLKCRLMVPIPKNDKGPSGIYVIIFFLELITILKFCKSRSAIFEFFPSFYDKSGIWSKIPTKSGAICS